MFPSTSPLQDRRGASKGLGLSVQPATSMNANQGTSLPPLKSPRGHLLDRIRSTPRSSKFVPQGAQNANASTPVKSANHIAHSQWTNMATPPPPSEIRQHQHKSSASRGANLYTPQRHAYTASMTTPSMPVHDLAKSDQLAVLEQQLRSSNNLLAQQQMLLQKLQYQQQYQQSMPCPTPPYTPEARASPAQNSIVYDPTTGQYYMYAPQYSSAPQLQYTSTPAQQKKQHDTVDTHEVHSRAARSGDDRSPSPPKEGSASRQPKGPPAIELLADKNCNLNFATRSKQALPKASISVSRARSRSSQRSNQSLGPIEEAFPAITL